MHIAETVGGAIIGRDLAVCTIRNDDFSISMSIADAAATEGDTGATTMQFAVELSTAAATPCTVDFETADGTARAGSDYAATSGTVTFAAGELRKFIAVPIHGDMEREDDEQFVVRLTSATGARLLRAVATGTIYDNDAEAPPSAPAVTIMGAAIDEGNSGTTSLGVRVELSSPASTPVSVAYRTANGSAIAGADYVAANAQLTFAPGETVKFISIAILGDTVAEPDETFAVKIAEPAGGATIANDTAVCSIRNDDRSKRRATRH